MVSLLQPAYFVTIFTPKEDTEVQLSNANRLKQPPNEALNGPPGSKKSSLVDAFMQYVERCNDFINRFVQKGSGVWSLVQAFCCLT